MAIFIDAGPGQNIFVWTVQVYGYNLNDSNVFFFRLEPTEKNSLSGIQFSFFNITDQSAGSSSATRLSRLNITETIKKTTLLSSTVYSHTAFVILTAFYKMKSLWPHPSRCSQLSCNCKISISPKSKSFQNNPSLSNFVVQCGQLTLPNSFVPEFLLPSWTSIFES